VYLPILMFHGAGSALTIVGRRKTTPARAVIAPAVCRMTAPSPEPDPGHHSQVEPGGEHAAQRPGVGQGHVQVLGGLRPLAGEEGGERDQFPQPSD